MIDKESICQEALRLIQQDVTDYENAQCFITDKISFNVRELIKECRRNYWGIFKDPIDENTGRERVWIPLTESIVDAVVKNIDLDTKDVNLRAKNPSAIGKTAILRAKLRQYLAETGFGEKLDSLSRTISVDGTCVWKTYEEYKNNKKSLVYTQTERLNLYFDPISPSLAKAPSVTERSLYTEQQIKSQKGWIDTDNIVAYTNMSPIERNGLSTTMSSAKKIEVYERWGFMPEWLITGNKNDTKLIEGRIVASNAMNGGKVHLIERNTKIDCNGDPLRPYEECWYQKIDNRWDGRGPSEKIINLQMWINTIVNIRITRSYVSQLGLFKIKKGSGITAGMLARLAVNGGIQVQNMEDIQQFPMQEASSASYQDENMAVSWANRSTSVFEAVTGETMPSSTPATNAAIAKQAGQSQFVLVKEGIGMFLQRWIRRHVLPALAKQLTSEEIIELTGEASEISAIDEAVTNKLLAQEIQKILDDGKFVSPEQVMKKKQQILEKLKSYGDKRFVRISDEDYDPSEYDVEVYVTNEEIDTSILSRNLLDMLGMVANNPSIGVDPNMILRQVFDVMGLDSSLFKAKQPTVLDQAQLSEQANKLQPMPSQNPTQQLTTVLTSKMV